MKPVDYNQPPLTIWAGLSGDVDFLRTAVRELPADAGGYGGNLRMIRQAIAAALDKTDVLIARHEADEERAFAADDQSAVHKPVAKWRCAMPTGGRWKRSRKRS